MVSKMFRGMHTIGASSPEEVLLLVPKGYSDFRPVHCDFMDGEAFCGEVRVISSAQRHPEKSIWSFDVKADTITLRVSFFGPHPSKSKDWADLKIGLSIYLKGIIRQFGSHLHLTKSQRVPPHFYGRMAAQYRSIPKVMTGDRLREHICEFMADERILEGAVRLLHERLSDASPGLSELRQLLHQLHLPKSPEESEQAVQQAKRLSVRAVLAHSKRSEIHCDPRSRVPLDWFDLQILKGSLPFALSPSQEQAIEGIVEQLESDRPMRALLSGDVGSGKTLTYALPAVAAWKTGARVAILAPNTPLAVQIAGELRRHFPTIASALLTGEGADRPPDRSLLIGTTALIAYAERTGWQADFLVIDEQQKFGLEQKRALVHEGTNLLEATATCIPRTLGLIKHGNLPIFRLRAHAAKQLHTRVVGVQDRSLLRDRLLESVAANERVMVIYPQVATGENDYRRNALAAFEKWEQLAPGKATLLHGRMSDAEKEQALSQVVHGQKPVLVSTSIMEVGISIPKLRLGIVVSADRYGTSTLHQMRGRLAREGGEGHFYLYLPFDTHDADLSPERRELIDRLQLLEQTQDGFDLAERDAARRGYGDLLHGEDRQHGKTATVFLGLTLTPDDFERSAEFGETGQEP